MEKPPPHAPNMPVAVLEQASAPPATAASKKPVWLVWLILPCIFLVLHGAFLRAAGPYYATAKFDPDYAYLCNSLNIAIGLPPSHVDHPGTTLQLLGAAVITAARPFAGKAEKIDAVLKNPERHLQRINFTLALTYASCLALIGLTVWRRTGDWQAALLLQTAPWLLGNQFHFAARVSAESLLLIIGLLTATVLFLELRRDQPRPRTAGVLGFLAATAVITKINFFPLALVPLAALRNWMQRVTFLVCGGVFGVLWLLPLGSNRSRFFAWIQGLVFRQKRYGYGEEGIIPPQYLSTLLRIVTRWPWLSLAIGVSLATTLYGCIRWKQQSSRERRAVLLLGALALGQALVILMAAKYGTPRYIFPALLFCPLNVLLLIEFWGARVLPMRHMIFIASMIAVLLSFRTLRRAHSNLSEATAARMEITRALENDFKDEPKVFCYGSSSPYHALWFGNYWAGEHYTKELAAIFGTNPPSYLVHEDLIRKGLPEVRLMAEPMSVRDLRNGHSSLLVVGGTFQVQRTVGSLGPNAKAEQVMLRAGEVMYRVTFE
jgi:hypothetical protein